MGVPVSSADAGYGFEGHYQGQHAGADVRSNLGPGMVPSSAADAGYGSEGFYQGQHAGYDARGNLGPGVAPVHMPEAGHWGDERSDFRYANVPSVSGIEVSDRGYQYGSSPEYLRYGQQCGNALYAASPQYVGEAISSGCGNPSYAVPCVHPGFRDPYIGRPTPPMHHQPSAPAYYQPA